MIRIGPFMFKICSFNVLTWPGTVVQDYLVGRSWWGFQTLEVVCPLFSGWISRIFPCFQQNLNVLT